MKWLYKGLLSIGLVLPHLSFASVIDDAITQTFERKFASIVLLTDSDAVQFGIHNFNPNALLNTSDPDLGTPESIENRNTKSVYSVPYTIAFPSSHGTDRHFINLKLFWIHTETEFTLFESETVNDELIENTFGGSVGYAYRHQWSDKFSITPSITTHLMSYRNKFKANNEVSELFSGLLSGKILNTKAWANLYQPAVQFTYTQPQSWGSWRLSSSWNYVYGYGGGEANDGHIGNPETWYTINQAVFNIELPKFKYIQSMFVGVERVDLSGDAVAEFNTNHYYEASVGYLIHRPFTSDLVDNIGIGLNFNYGSDFKGGAIVLYFNK